MGRLPRLILVTLAGAFSAGCAGASGSRNSTAANPAAQPAPATAAPAPTPTNKAAPSTTDAMAMQQVIAELQQLGALDPGAQEKLMADLRQTDPRLWPLVLQQFRAAVAYRRQAQDREMAGATPNADPVATSLSPQMPRAGAEASRISGPIEPLTPLRPETAPATPVPPPESIATEGPLPPSKPDIVTAATPRPKSLPAVSRTSTAGQSKRPGEAADVAAKTPNGRPRNRTPVPPSEVADAPAAAEENPATPVVPVSYEASTVAGTQSQINAAIAALEAESKGANPKTDAEIAQQVRLRMLYLLAGRRDEAVRPIPAVPTAVQDFWSKQLFGMATWLDAEKNPDSVRRAAETKRVLEEAVARLGESAPLIIRNLTFCTAVQSYGSMTPCKKYEFSPGQEVLLYAEVDNFGVEASAKGYQTSLKSSYLILDSGGQRVADHEFSPVEEQCQNPRRDFFLGCHLHLPKRMYSGKHTLQLTVEDQKSHKVGQSTIEFTIKGGEE